MTTDEWNSLADRTNCWALDLLPHDGEPRTDAILATFDLPQTDNYLRDWTPVIGADEQAAVDAAVAQYTTDIADEQAKSSPDTDQIARWQRQIDELNAGAYWQEAPNAFGDGGTALYRALSTPNIPCEIRSNWLVDQDRPWSIWVYRSKPDDAQRDAELDIEWAHWRLRLKSESAAELYRFVDGVSWETIAATEANIDAIRDSGRLTGTDKANIKTWKDAIAAIKAAAKPGDPDAAESVQIKDYEDQIATLKESKDGLTKAQTLAVKALEDTIYEDVQQVTLAETTQSLFNQPFNLTFFPQQRGFMTIAKDQGKNSFTYEDKLVTKEREFAVMQARSRVRIKGNGGSFMFQAGYPNVARYFRMLSRYIGLGFTWDGTGSTMTGNFNQMPGTAVTWSVERDPTDSRRVRYLIEGTTDGRYSPFLYAVDLEIAGGARTPDNAVLWSSLGKTYEPVLNCSPRQEERGGHCISKAYRVEVLNTGGAADLLENCTGYQARLFEDGAPMFWGHVTADPGWDLIHEEPGKRSDTISLLVADGWDVLKHSNIEDALVGDGKALGTYLTQVMQGPGLLAAEIDISIPGVTLPTANPGEEKRVRPNYGTTRAEWVRHLMETYAPNCEAYWTEQHVFTARERPTTVTRTLTDTRNVAGQRNVAMRPIAGGRDTGDFYNDILVVGGTDPETKKRYAARFIDYESLRDRTSDRFVGRRLKMTHTNGDLNTPEKTAACCRRLVQVHNRANLFRQVETHWDNTLQIGQRASYDGSLVEVMQVDGGGHSTDRMRLQVRYV